MPEANPSTRRVLLTIAGLVLGAVIVYLGVSTTALRMDVPVNDAESGRARLPLQPWTPETWSGIQQRQDLVLLLITDSLTSRTFDTAALRSALPSGIRRGVTPVRIDVRARPDLAERYSEGQAPFASVLLPTGEALTTLAGSPDTWQEMITEAFAYWRDHREEMTERVADFWDHAGAIARPETGAGLPLPVPDQLDDLVHGRVKGALDTGEDPAVIWRVDMADFLLRRAAGETWARTDLERVMRARARQWDLLLDSLARYLDAQTLGLLALQQLHSGVDTPEDGERLARQVLDYLERGEVLRYAADFAVLYRLRGRLHAGREGRYAGNWLPYQPGDSVSLPHDAGNPGALNGYLMDALAWLERFTDTTAGADTIAATRLGDSIWHNLWAPEAQALRDKPVEPTAVRERTVFPRAQLGRTALAFVELAELTGDQRWTGRAQACLRGFAPFVRDAGLAAAYYASGYWRLHQFRASRASE